ncbi:MAG: di-trans,poly-cis-decaprenylcistransferase [Xanthomonadales bacterium]|nr:di-trans,poly-cis-decaprenylcistransferase [Xanthomonadales bacterium]
MSQATAQSNLRKPVHVAIIMDGNGRWAKARHRPRTLGHRAGARAVNLSIDFCLSQGIDVLTLFAFSSENWQRPADEVSALMSLFLRVLDRELDELHRRGVRLRFIGAREDFPPELQTRMHHAETHTRHNARLNLCIAASYGGRWDITQAVQAIARKVASGEIDVAQINEVLVNQHLSLAELAPPDLFIRTGGDHRISNFLLWQLAYTELYFTETLWPDLTEHVLQAALDDFAQRERRFGMTSDQLPEVKA